MTVDTERLTLAAFIENTGLSMDAAGGRAGEWDGWPAHHWTCTIRRRDGRALETPFKMGTGHGGRAPTLPLVLSALADDAAAYDDARDVGEWAGEMGYDTGEPEDYDRALKLYDAVSRQSDQLRALLTAEEYDTLLWDTDRQ